MALYNIHFEIAIPCREAELIKYAGNCWFYAKVLMMNVFYDIAEKNNLDFEIIKEVMGADKRVGKTHLDVEHQGGRGAGGHCFIKDFEVMKIMYGECKGFEEGYEFLIKAIKYNRFLLKSTDKSLRILKKVYGD